MAPKIYTSPYPSQPLYNHSVFSHLFFSDPKYPNKVGGYPGSSPAFIDAPTGTSISRSQLKNFALSLAYGIKKTFSAKRGDTILVFSQNSLTWPVVVFGAVAAGLRCTLANSAYNARELAFQYTDSGANLIFASEEGVATARETLKSLGLSADDANKRIVVMATGLGWAGGPSTPITPASKGLLTVSDLLGLGSIREEEKFEGKLAHETVYLCYSSGTTGKPKGVETTHRNICSVLECVRPVFPEIGSNDTMLGVLPFYHIYGAVKLLHFPFQCNTPVAVMPRFDPEQFCANVERYNATVALIVPPVLVVLARHPAVDKYDMSSMQTLLSGAAPLGAALTKQVQSRLITKRKGKGPVYILQGYGLTETSPTTHIVPIEGAETKLGSIGVLLPGLEARLVVDGDGNGDIDAAEGQAGEIWIRGPTVMKGYLNNPAATKEAITPDGWFKTGDIATRDADGYYRVVDRRKELIKYKGFQVPPAELESVLLTHPEIADVAVIGVDSAKEATELPRAYVVHARPEEMKTEAQRIAFSEDVKQWIQSKVARHKYLRGGVVVIDIIPKSAAGKILRRELRDKAKEELAGRDPADNNIKAKL
ncbi:4-coumarate--CoA ligase-like 7 [Psilocybe cubensis]|uniref:AMP binding protein n=2 Tax=Psilocybe cubensis TaxID=181762 RepID=A0A8H7Y704_PSICU|nr:4-coumarate--CoA ligase-like 7 [Psilocybe cubensis]KAH9485035.1 4-coumarate--CoA ligase-like 7 [Psilocybe cubensis]